jgi:hypothetical protein
MTTLPAAPRGIAVTLFHLRSASAPTGSHGRPSRPVRRAPSGERALRGGQHAVPAQGVGCPKYRSMSNLSPRAVGTGNRGGRRSAFRPVLRTTGNRQVIAGSLPASERVATAVRPIQAKGGAYGPRVPSESTVAAKGVCPKWSKEDRVPPPRGSVTFCDAIDEHGTELVNLIEMVQAITVDGIVNPHENALFELASARAMKSYAPLPGRGAEVDDALRSIGCIAHAGRVSRKAYSTVKQAYEDTRGAA